MEIIRYSNIEFTNESIAHIITIKINDKIQINTKTKSMNNSWFKNEYIFKPIPFHLN